MKALILSLTFLAGCYSYTPIAPTTAMPGVEVRARITGAASDRVAPLLGAFDTRELVGSVVENKNGDIILDVDVGTRPNAAESGGPLRARVPLVPADVLSLEQRKLDRMRTTMLVGGILAAAGAGVAVALHSGGGADEGKSPAEPPTIIRIPIRLWSFTF